MKRLLLLALPLALAACTKPADPATAPADATPAATATGFVVVKWLLGFIKAHRFTGFAIYRIVLGALLLLLMPVGS